MDDFFIGLDCGQAHDYSALSVLRRQGSRFEVVHLERLALDMPYPEQIEYVHQVLHRRPLDKANVVFVLDYTGVGRPVWDLAKARDLRPVGITITGGDRVSWLDGRNRARVPKRDLIAGLQIAAQNDRLKVAGGLKFGPILAEELQNFKVKIDPKTAHDSYGTWREGQHDDLILSVAIALWTAENWLQVKAVFRAMSSGGRSFFD
ncbi:MAG: hypothetical protein QUS09_10625 [Methanotrichaceae archaeon]|nr:hypothetical protein [Methanotrichaceae archaeon]